MSFASIAFPAFVSLVSLSRTKLNSFLSLPTSIKLSGAALFTVPVAVCIIGFFIVSVDLAAGALVAGAAGAGAAGAGGGAGGVGGVGPGLPGRAAPVLPPTDHSRSP